MIKLKNLRETFGNKLDTLREKLQSFWSELAPREKLILIVAGSLAGFLAVIFLGQQLGQIILRSGPSAQTTYADSKEALRYISELKNQRFQAQRFDRLKTQRAENFNLEEFLQKNSKLYGLQVESILPKKIASSKEVDPSDKLFEVKLKSGSSLDASLRFLNQIEEILGLRILELNMAPQFDDPTKLNVQFLLALKEKL